MKLALQV